MVCKVITNRQWQAGASDRYICSLFLSRETLPKLGNIRREHTELVSFAEYLSLLGKENKAVSGLDF